MADKVTNYICPACLGSVHFNATNGKIECDFCGSLYTVEEMEEMMKAQNQAAVEEAGKVDEWEAVQQGWIGEGMKAYSCPSCKAELICDETTAATACPYCGNPTCVPAQFENELKPDFILPFKLEKQAAVDKLKAHCSGKKLLPRSFTANNHLEEIKGVYVPFWLYDGIAKGGANYTGEKKHTRTTSDERITTTEHYNIARAGEVPFEKIPADGSSKMPDDLMDSIEPYEYSDLVPFQKAYLAGYLADKYDVTAEQNAERVEERAKNTLQEMLRSTVDGYDTVSTVQSRSVITQGKVSYALMPVWLLSTNWNGQNFLFAMNGQTGKMVGDLPIDNAKYWKIIIGIVVVFDILMAILTRNTLAASTIAMHVVKFVAVPFLIAFIVGGILRGQMKSVFTAGNAREYMDKKKLELTRRIDAFSHTTEKREKIQKQQN